MIERFCKIVSNEMVTFKKKTQNTSTSLLDKVL